MSKLIDTCLFNISFEIKGIRREFCSWSVTLKNALPLHHNAEGGFTPLQPTNLLIRCIWTFLNMQCILDLKMNILGLGLLD